MNWIDCKEMLPKAGQLCLLYRPDAENTQDSLYRVAVFTGEHFACYVQPSHWAALTSPLLTSEHIVSQISEPIDRSKAPLDATHYFPKARAAGWRKYEDGSWWSFVPGAGWCVTSGAVPDKYIELTKCCVPTADEEVLLATGEYTPEELWGGPRPTCPKCFKVAK